MTGEVLAVITWCLFAMVRCSPLCQLKSSENSFHWIGNDVRFYDHEGNDCPLLSYRVNENLTNSSVRLISIGDSMDNYACERIRRSLTKHYNWIIPPITRSVAANESHYETVRNCTVEKGLAYFFYRMNGILVHEKDIVKKKSDLLNKFTNIKKGLEEESLSPTHISFGTHLWDILAPHYAYCYRFRAHPDRNIMSFPNNISCVCNETMRNDHCYANSHDAFQRIEFPYHTVAAEALWQEAYIETITHLRDLFPSAVILIRTQPPSLRIGHGNLFVQTARNQFIRGLVRRRLFPNLHLLDYHALYSGGKSKFNSDGHHYNYALTPWNDVLLNTVLNTPFIQ